MRFREMAQALGLMVAGVLLATTGGCNSWLDQSELTRGPQNDRRVVDILDSVDQMEAGEVEFGHAQDVRPGDLKVVATDYVIGRNDLVTVSIFDLVNQGVESVRTARVSETGTLSLPLLNDPVRAAGFTEAQLQREIARKYREAKLIQNAQVSVTVTEARNRTFNITGAVVRPGQYIILESDFRLLQALIQAGDTSYPTEYAYVIRKLASEAPSATPAGTDQTPQTPTTGPADLAPRSQGPAVVRPVMMAEQPAGSATPAAAEKDRYITIDGKTVLIGGDKPETSAQPAVEGTAPVANPPTTQPFEFGAGLSADQEERIIRVPLQALKNGDLRYNIVVRPNDLIIVPNPLTGFYYMGGHVGQPGVYSFSGQKVTLMQAVIAARNLDPLAVPSRTDLVRRLEGQRAVFVRVDLGRIFQGKDPDIFLKPNDTITVGTDFYTPFLAAVRNAFRMTYGFGFLYDRNYAPAQEQRFRSQVQ